MPLLNRGEAMLNRRLGQASPVALTYTRGATTITIASGDGAWLSGRTRFASTLESGVRIEWSDRDYLIPVALLSALPASTGITAGEPAEGDRITETVNGTACTFDVLKPDTGEKAWTYSDAGRTRFRIHTKQVG